MKNSAGSASVSQVFERFIMASLAKGVSESTIKTYRSHFKCISHHLDIDISRYNERRGVQKTSIHP